MKGIWALAIAVFLLTPLVSRAAATSTQETPQAQARRLAAEYGVPFYLLDYIITNETHWKPHAVGDMDITCKRTGKPVRARGIMQLTECWYSHVPDACAFDTECALRVALPLIAKKHTCMSQWTTCRRYYSTLALK